MGDASKILDELVRAAITSKPKPLADYTDMELMEECVRRGMNSASIDAGPQWQSHTPGMRTKDIGWHETDVIHAELDFHPELPDREIAFRLGQHIGQFIGERRMFKYWKLPPEQNRGRNMWHGKLRIVLEPKKNPPE